eukprot:gene13828-18543_t
MKSDSNDSVTISLTNSEVVSVKNEFKVLTGYTFNPVLDEDCKLWVTELPASVLRYMMDNGLELDSKVCAWLKPYTFDANMDIKRSFDKLIKLSGLVDHLHIIPSRLVTTEELLLFHSKPYLNRIYWDKEMECTVDCHPTRNIIAGLSVGSVLATIEAVIEKTITNGYCLTASPGELATQHHGVGFCVFNNIVLGALHARIFSKQEIVRIAIVSYSPHHPTAIQDAFWDDSNCLFISLHQENLGDSVKGNLTHIGGNEALGCNINIPLPSGCGNGAYKYAFRKIVLPSLHRYQPDLILVNSGYDASFADALSGMMITSEAYRFFVTSLVDVANEICDGRIVVCHEGGFNEEYVGYCGIAVIESLCGHFTDVADPYLVDIRNCESQETQDHQRYLIDKVAFIHNLQQEPITSPLPGENYCQVDYSAVKVTPPQVAVIHAKKTHKQCEEEKAIYDDSYGSWILSSFRNLI